MRTAGRIMLETSSRGVWTRAPWRVGVVLAALCAAVYLPGVFSIPPVDRDECRFAQASRQMLQTGDWVVPRFQDRTRLNKPPLIYWIQAFSARLFDDPAARGAGAAPPADDPTAGIWRYRLPSVVAATLSVLLTWRLGSRMFDPRAAALAAALLAVSPMVVWDAHQARADQVLLLTVVAAQAALWEVWRSRHHSGRPWLAPLAFWIALVAGVMTKGPVAPMISGLTAIGLSLLGREWRWLLRLRPVAGLILIAAVAGGWLALVAGNVGWDHLAEKLRRELVERQAAPMEGHSGPPGYHVLLLLLLFWPGTLAAAAGIVRAWRLGLGRGLNPVRWSARGRDAERFCLAWIIPAWVVFELVGTKLPHYTMPLYPPMALLSARALPGVLPPAQSANRRERAVWTLAMSLWVLVGVAIIAGIPSALAYLDNPGEPLSLLGLSLAIGARMAALCLLAVSTYLLFRARPVKSQLASLAAIAISLAATTGVVVPHQSGDAWVSSKIVAAVRQVDPTLARPLAAVRFHEDSLVFLTGGRVDRIDEPPRRDDLPGLDQWFADHPRGLAVVPPGLAKSRPWLHDIVHISGWNYSRGQRVELAIVERRP